ncbi:MAG: glutamate racemase [Candidatus Omnitrophica bacterium]|nr:glutamate racemase [Candidatus Omnitrophota bacterium]
MPIGIFDSGIGGLTVLKEIKRLLPDEDIVYFGDTARVPYGIKSRDTVIKFSMQNANFLLSLNVKMIIAACNTSSSCSLQALKKRFPIPVIGVIEPGVKEAAAKTKNMRLGVIGTRATVSSGAYQQAIKKANPHIFVKAVSCPLFVPLAEEGWLDDEITHMVASRYLKTLKEEGIDTIILGCTHYPLLEGVIRRVLGSGVNVVDSATQTAKSVKRTLIDNSLQSSRKKAGSYKFFVSDEERRFKEVGSKFLGSRIEGVKRVSVD